MIQQRNGELSRGVQQVLEINAFQLAFLADVLDNQFQGPINRLAMKDQRPHGQQSTMLAKYAEQAFDGGLIDAELAADVVQAGRAKGVVPNPRLDRLQTLGVRAERRLVLGQRQA